MNQKPMSRRDALARTLLGAVVAATAAAVGCSNDSDAAPTPTTAGGGATTTTPDIGVADEDFVSLVDTDVVDIDVIDNAFEPRWIIVSPGTKVRWTNKGRNHHNIVPEPEGSFAGVEHEQFPNGSVHAVTFDAAGDFPYYCSLHGTPRNGQNGVIRVVS